MVSTSYIVSRCHRGNIGVEAQLTDTAHTNQICKVHPESLAEAEIHEWIQHRVQQCYDGRGEHHCVRHHPSLVHLYPYDNHVGQVAHVVDQEKQEELQDKVEILRFDAARMGERSG